MNEFSALMARTGLTTPQIALLMGVNVRTVRRWRSGASPAPLAAIVVLSIINKHGMTMAATLNVAALDEWIRLTVMGMKEDGLSAIQRRLGLGYGVIARILRR